MQDRRLIGSAPIPHPRPIALRRRSDIPHPHTTPSPATGYRHIGGAPTSPTDISRPKPQDNILHQYAPQARDIGYRLGWCCVDCNKEVTMDASAGISLGRGDALSMWIPNTSWAKGARRRNRLPSIQSADRMLTKVLTKPVAEKKMNSAMKGVSLYLLAGERELTLT